ncbi:MAG: PA14 domain-containing protein, partial [Planctomycetota bacterium]
DGRVRPIRGALAMALEARARGLEGVILPAENADEAAVVEGVQVFGVPSLSHLVGLLSGHLEAEPHPPVDVASLVADTEPPQLVAVHPAGTNLLRVAFNEPVDPVSAGNPANYALNPSVEIVGAEVDADGTSAVIEVAQPLNDGAAYGLTAREIADASEAGNSATLSTEFTYHSRVPGLQYAYYETKDKKAMEAGLKDVEPTATGTTDAIGIDLAERGENYALRFTGMLVVAESGEYTFYTTSDDGSFLSIDGEQVVENGGWHGMQEEKGTVTLEPGPHEFEVYFFQGGGGDGLEVEWKAPGGDKEEIPASVLCHKPGA